MNVLLAGASGAIGVPLTRHLIAAGHRVVGLSRTPSNHDTLRARRQDGGRRRPSPAGCCSSWSGALVRCSPSTALLFFGAGSLMLGGYISGPEDPGLWAVVRWYTFLWGPWFVVGGTLFMAAGWPFLRGRPDQRTGWASSMIGVLGGLGVSVAMLLLGIG